MLFLFLGHMQGKLDEGVWVLENCCKLSSLHTLDGEPRNSVMRLFFWMLLLFSASIMGRLT